LYALPKIVIPTTTAKQINMVFKCCFILYFFKLVIERCNYINILVFQMGLYDEIAFLIN